MSQPAGAIRRLAPFLFILSGMAGLLMQVAWFRLLALSLGGTLAAATSVLSAFMGGLALGAWLLARRASGGLPVTRARGLERPLRAYGLLEIAAGLLALLTLPLIGGLDRVVEIAGRSMGPDSPALLAMKVLLAAFVLMPATTAMGGTLPALCDALVRSPEHGGLRTGGLYALNTWGAVAGSLLALFFTIPRWGLSGTVLAGALVDLAVGALVLAWARETPEPLAPGAQDASSAASSSPGDVRLARLLAATLFVTGAAGLAYEVLWTRALAFYFGSGAHGFAIMLAVVLTGLALGAFIGGSLADRQPQPLIVLAVSQALMALAITWQAWRMPDLPEFLYQLALRAGSGGVTFGELGVLLLLGGLQVLLPASVLMGAALPVAVRALLRSGGGAGALVGRLHAANSLGTIPGAILATWALVPALGLSRSLLALAGVNVLVAFLLARELRTRARRLTSGLAVVMAALLAVVAFRLDPLRVFQGSGSFHETPESGLLAVQESPHGTVTISQVDDDRGRWLSLSVDAVNVAGTSPSLLACQSMQGHLPLMLHRAPRSVVHVGFGSGGTAAAVASHDEVQEIHVVEINPAILRMSNERLRAVNGGVLDDPRVRVHLQDGRNWLLASDRRFDCILSDSIHPRYRGNSSLYTVEYFRLCRSRLNPGGLVSTWLPIYSLSAESLRSIVASMRQVFPQTSVWYLNSTVNEFVILVGRTDEDGISVPRIEEVLAAPGAAASLERVGVKRSADVLDYFIGEGASLGPLAQRARENRDDDPWVELESAAVVGREASWFMNLQQVVDARSSVLPHLQGASPELLDELARREPATGLMLRAHLAMLRRDRQGVETFARQAQEAFPPEREPWDFFGPPEWMRSFMSGDAP